MADFAELLAAARAQPCAWCGSHDRAVFDSTVCARCLAGRPERALVTYPESYGFSAADVQEAK